MDITRYFSHRDGNYHPMSSLTRDVLAREAETYSGQKDVLGYTSPPCYDVEHGRNSAAVFLACSAGRMSLIEHARKGACQGQRRRRLTALWEKALKPHDSGCCRILWNAA